MTPGRRNPYMGPEAFGREDAPLFFGRQQELRDLVALAATERLLLFYASSGAGKTSLLNAKLIPALEAKLYEVLPVARVSGAADVPATVRNVYSYNIMVGLAKGEPSPERFAELSLGDFLRRLSTDDGRQYSLRDSAQAMRLTVPPDELWPRVLVLDQFEEIITTYPTFWRHREDFFRQLDAAMRADPLLRVILCLRSDFVQDLDRYAGLLENGLRSRYHMLPMGTADGLAAIEEPARAFDHPFDEGVARRLVENLSQVREQDATGQVSMVAGEWVEPIQLQVVCYQLWERLWPKLAQSPGEPIDGEDLRALAGASEATSSDSDKAPPGELDRLSGFVDGALASFYEDALALALATAPGTVDESFLRDWFSTKLITDSGTRGFLQRGTEETAGVPEPMVAALVDRHLLRGDVRGGTRLVELVHDRFVAPIRRANRLWYERRMQDKPWLAAAMKWYQSGSSRANRDAGLLLRGASLTAVLAETKGQRLEPAVADYLDESERARQRRRSRWLAAAAGSVVVVAVVAVSVFLRLWQTAEANAAAASAARSEAQSLRLAFLARSSLAQTAGLDGQSGVEQALLLATEAMNSTPTLQSKLAMLEALGHSRRQRRDGLSLAADPTQTGSFLSAAPLKWPFSPTVLSVSPDGRRVAGAAAGRVAVLAATGAGSARPVTIRVPTELALVNAIALSHDGQWLAVAGCDPAVTAAEGGADQPEAVTDTVRSSAKSKQFVQAESTPCSAARKRLEVWNLGTSPPSSPVITAQADDLREEITALDIHPYEPALLSGSIDGTIREWRIVGSDTTATRTPGQDPALLVPQDERTWLHGPSPLADLAIDGGGGHVAALSTTGAIKIFHWDDLKGVFELPAAERQTDRFQSIAFTQNGEWLATNAVCAGDDCPDRTTIEIRDWQNAPDAVARIVVPSPGAGPGTAPNDALTTEQTAGSEVGWPPTDLRSDREHDVLLLASPAARAAWLLDGNVWTRLACAGARRNLTYGEWTAAFPDEASDKSDYWNNLTCPDFGLHTSFAAERIDEAREKINDCTADGVDAGLAALVTARDMLGDAAATLGLPVDEDEAVRVLLQAQAAAVANRDAPLAANCRQMAAGVIARSRPDWPGMATALDLGLSLAQAEALVHNAATKDLKPAFDAAERVLGQRAAWPFDLSAGLARVYAVLCMGHRQQAACQRLASLAPAARPGQAQRAILDGEVGTTWAVPGTSGQVLDVSMSGDEADFNPELILSGPDGTPLAETSDAGGHPDARIGPFRVPRAGNYFVHTGGRSALGATHVYTLTVSALRPTAIEVGQTVPARPGSGGLWSFDARADQVLDLVLTANGAGSAPATAPALRLYDAAGALLAESEAATAGPDTRISAFVVPRAGPYFARAAAVAGESDPSARYSLAVSTTAPP